MARGTDYQALLDRVVLEPDGLDVQPVGEWTLNKLALLSYYLPAFAKICTKSRWHGWYYIDAFAGVGANGAPGFAPFMGSATIGVTTVPSPTFAVLVEQSMDNAAVLRQRCDRLAKAPFDLQDGDANEVLVRGLEKLPDRRLPGFCMLDPFATQLHWATVQALASWRTAETPYELLIYFPTPIVSRIAAVTDPIQAAVHARQLTDLFGNDEWMGIAEQQRRSRLKAQEPGLLYLELYRRRLMSLGYREPLTRPSMRQQGGLMYHLLFATGNENGEKIMKRGLETAYLSNLPLPGFF